LSVAPELVNSLRGTLVLGLRNVPALDSTGLNALRG
jgi:hypothetical protein